MRVTFDDITNNASRVGGNVGCLLLVPLLLSLWLLLLLLLLLLVFEVFC
jgi:hypothetical protein